MQEGSGCMLARHACALQQPVIAQLELIMHGVKWHAALADSTTCDSECWLADHPWQAVSESLDISMARIELIVRVLISN